MSEARPIILYIILLASILLISTGMESDPPLIAYAGIALNSMVFAIANGSIVNHLINAFRRHR